MEFYPDLYKRACSKLTAPPDAVKEVIRMTEMQKKPRKWTRRMLVAIAVTVLAMLTVVGASAAFGGGDIFTRVTAFMQSPQQMPDTHGGKCLIRMANDMGEETSFVADRVEYIPETNCLKVWFDSVDGDVIWLKLQLDENFRQYGSYQEMLEGEETITGVTDDGETYTINAE